MKLNFQQQVVIEQLSATSGLSDKEVSWIARRSFSKSPEALTASGHSKMPLSAFESRLNAAVFHYQIEELDSDFEAELLTLIASAIDPMAPQLGRR